MDQHSFRGRPLSTIYLTPRCRIKTTERLAREEGNSAEKSTSLIFVENINCRLSFFTTFLGPDLGIVSTRDIGSRHYEKVRNMKRNLSIQSESHTLNFNRRPRHRTRLAFAVLGLGLCWLGFVPIFNLCVVRLRRCLVFLLLVFFI